MNILHLVSLQAAAARRGSSAVLLPCIAALSSISHPSLRSDPLLSNPHIILHNHSFHTTSSALNSKPKARSSANWTFSTKYPRSAPSSSASPISSRFGKKKNKKRRGPVTYPKRSNQPSQTKMRGLALPPRLKLDSNPARWAAANAASQAAKKAEKTSGGVGRRSSEPVKIQRPEKPKKLTPQELLKQAQREQKQLEWKRAQQAHAEKFAMTPLETSSSRIAHLKEEVKRSQFFTSMTYPATETGPGAPVLRSEILVSVKTYLKHDNPKATAVQALAIPVSLSEARQDRTMLIGAETGSGKTLAYLVPMIQRLKDEEDRAVEKALTAQQPTIPQQSQEIDEDGLDIPPVTDSVKDSALSNVRKLQRPRAIVLVPTRELVQQVQLVAKGLCAHGDSHGGGVRLAVVGLHSRPSDAKRMTERLLTSPIDILISTPKALKKRVDEGDLFLSRVNEIVVDEADTMLDTGFSTELDDILVPLWESAAKREQLAMEIKAAEEQANASNTNVPADIHKKRRQLADLNVRTPLVSYVTATMPLSMTRRIAKVHPTHMTITTPSMHKTLPKLQQAFIRCSPQGPKDVLLMDTIKRAVVSGEKRIIVFCNRRKSAEAVYELLKQRNMDASLITADMDQAEKKAALKYFTPSSAFVARRMQEAKDGNNADTENDDVDMQWEEDNDGLRVAPESNAAASKVKILVATDVASRGLDTISADHVLLYDFPHTAIDYLHRVGRTARNGTRGRATSLVTKKDIVMAETIEEAVKRKAALA